MFSLLVIYKDGSDHPVMNTIWAVVKIKLENKFQACMNSWPLWYWCSSLSIGLTHQLGACHFVVFNKPMSTEWMKIYTSYSNTKRWI